MTLRATSAFCLALCGLGVAAQAQDSCASGKTLTEDTLTIATGNPAYYPWVMNDAPESGEGFEAAVAYALAAEMGFSAEQVRWVRTSFDQSIQPGAKDFDINLQQFSITEEREKMVDFSIPYYSSAMAVLTTQRVIDEGATATIDSLKGLLWGADANTTAVPMLTGLIDPARAPLLYGDNTDVTAAMQAGQIDAALFDLPTALYLSAVVLNDGAILGQFPADRSDNPDQFGMLMEEGSALKECVDAALTRLTESGQLAEIEAEWLSQTTGVPVIE
ncbi:ABC transporter substrate-binding protein [Cognatishimia sp. F0-27]|uniref:ABC transporter substrate-binding protein n=1 Tax=Cognatishimia sp. F0-27 TaxID=2816855 RepID=UPI001D0C860C|nr:ABC transporter substrate-binding protein [Cognatishimia sp. F0-27]MCC1492214.1 amino acid ABC transporter substrate-binding protein [Cognatishimia sp. F0-27]